MHRNDINICVSRCELERSLDPDKPTYNKEAMVLAVARKKKSRMQKSSDFNCVVLEDEDELKDFIENLSADQEKFGPTKRFQVLFLYNNIHWIAMDCRLDNNQFDFFLIDAANYGLSIQTALQIMAERIPNANITYLALNAKTKIQRCYENCGTFALDILFGLSKIQNLYDLVSSQAIIIDDHLRSITLDNLPEELGCIMRNMHSISSLNALTNKKRYWSNSHTLLVDYFNAHIIHQDGNDINAGIDHKRKTIKNKALAYYKTLTNKEIAILLASNDFFNPSLMDDKSVLSKTDVCDEPDMEPTITPGAINQVAISLVSAIYGLFISNDDDGKEASLVQETALQGELTQQERDQSHVDSAPSSLRFFN